jgi:hypothetical protein
LIFFAKEFNEKAAASRRTPNVTAARSRGVRELATAFVAHSRGSHADFRSRAYIGPRGWVALRLDRGAIDWKEVAELVAGSYQLTTPKRLA